MKSISQLDSGHYLQQPICYQEGELYIGARPLSELVSLAGGTPCYLYDMEKARQQLVTLRRFLPENLNVYYAVKANPNEQVLSELLPTIDGLDVASQKELQRALSAGYDAQNCSFAGPSKSIAELEFALAQGAFVSAESKTEVARILDWAERNQTQVQFGLRINPAFELRASGMHMGGGAQPFGIDEEQVAEVIEVVTRNGWGKVTGLHIYAGSQCLQVSSLLELYDASLACFKRLQHQLNLTLTHLNLGGGLGVPYFPGNQPLDIEEFGAGFKELLSSYQDFLQGKKLILELGRYLMADAGYYVCRVNDIKESRGEAFVMVDGGMHHHLANSGNLGQLLRKNYPVVIGNKLAQCSVGDVNISGPLCTPLDVVAKKLATPKIEIGDFVVVLLSGAYGLTASPVGFLSQPEARELVIT